MNAVIFYLIHIADSFVHNDTFVLSVCLFIVILHANNNLVMSEYLSTKKKESHCSHIYKDEAGRRKDSNAHRL